MSKMLAFCLATAFSFLLGCGSGYNTASVSGKVTCNGEPVKNATVLFSPIPRSGDDNNPGKAGQGSTDDGGNYALSTYGHHDGAVVGKHNVSVIYPNANEKHACPPGALILEVVPGSNRLDIELAAKNKK